MNKTNIFLNKITTGKLVSARALTLMHTTHRDNARWSLCRKHSGFPRSRGNLPQPCREQRKEIEEMSSVPVRQHFVLDKT